MFMQAWGAYGTWWPVVHQDFGVAPDLGTGRLSVLPQLPPGEGHISLVNLRVGAGSLSEVVDHTGRSWTTHVTVTGLRRVTLSLGVVLPSGARVPRVSLDGHAVAFTAVVTHRGLEVSVPTAAAGRHTLVVTTR